MNNILLGTILLFGHSQSYFCDTMLENSFSNYVCKTPVAISEGTDFVIYYAHEKKFIKLEAAFKVMKCTDADLLKKAQNEFRILKTLSHPNIIGLVSPEMMQYNDRCVILHELGRGTLEFMITHKDPKIKDDFRKLKFLFGIAKGLKELKDKGIIHADLKPQNIFSSIEGIPKISHFSASLGGEGRYYIRGTPYYIDPEIIQNDYFLHISNYRYSVDIYGLGIILYKMTFGTEPFQADDENQLFRNIMDSNYVIPECNPYIAFLIFHMMARDQEKRPTIEQVLKWIAFAVRWTENRQTTEDLASGQLDSKRTAQIQLKQGIINNFLEVPQKINLGRVSGSSSFPEKGWSALGVDFVPDSKKFLDLENSGLLMKFDWGVASFIKNVGITQNTELSDIPFDSDEVPNELPKAKGALEKIKGLMPGNIFDKTGKNLI